MQVHSNNTSLPQKGSSSLCTNGAFLTFNNIISLHALAIKFFQNALSEIPLTIFTIHATTWGGGGGGGGGGLIL